MYMSVLAKVDEQFKGSFFLHHLSYQVGAWTNTLAAL